jgi:hypothetical protein
MTDYKTEREAMEAGQEHLRKTKRLQDAVVVVPGEKQGHFTWKIYQMVKNLPEKPTGHC